MTLLGMVMLLDCEPKSTKRHIFLLGCSIITLLAKVKATNQNLHLITQGNNFSREENMKATE